MDPPWNMKVRLVLSIQVPSDFTRDTVDDSHGSYVDGSIAE